jgi:hypothetical protein
LTEVSVTEYAGVLNISINGLGEVVRGYVACNLGDRTPTQVERRYRRRSAIKTSYRLFRQARATTTTQDPIVRFAFVIVSFLLENLWLVLRWAVVARPRRGGRDLPEEFTFKTFRDWIRHELEEELRRQWKIKANGSVCPHHRQRPRADPGQPTACPLGGERQLSADTVEIQVISSVRCGEADLLRSIPR